MNYVEGIKIIKVDVGRFDEIELYPVSDLHWSDANTDEKAFLRFCEFILEQPNRFIVMNGDLLDMALTLSVSDTYAEKYSPSESVNSLAEVLKVIAHRILAVGTGNHEDRVYKYTGIDVTEHLCLKSGIGINRYANNSFVLFITVGNNTYSGFFHHGVGGGRMKGGKVNMLVRMNQIVNTDFFCVGHTHDPIETVTKTFLIDMVEKTIREHKQYYMISNAWQKYGGYGQKFAFSPASNEITYMKLGGKERKISVTIGL